MVCEKKKEFSKYESLSFQALSDWVRKNHKQNNPNRQLGHRLTSQGENKYYQEKNAREKTNGRDAVGFAFHLIGWESGVSFLDQSQSVAKQTNAIQVYLRHSI